MATATRTATLTTDETLVRAVLSQDPVATAYMLGDLAPAYADFCVWYVSGPTGKVGDADTVLLVYTGLSAPVVLTYGPAAGVAAIFDAFIADLPERAHVHLDPEHLVTIDRYFAMDQVRPMVRMGLRAADFDRRTAHPHSHLVEPLSHRHTGEIIELYQHYPDSFFEPFQLTSGHYFGIRIKGVLVSVAGVHIVSETDGLAALGNIVTHPDHRGLGLSTACTAHLAGRLFDDGMSVLALNVVRANASAMRVYEKLGFRENNTYLEGFLTRPLDLRVPR